MATRILRFREGSSAYQFQYLHARKAIVFDNGTPTNWNDIWTQEEADYVGNPGALMIEDGARWWSGNQWEIRRTAVLARAGSLQILSGRTVVGWGFRVHASFQEDYTTGKLIIQSGVNNPHDTPKAEDFNKEHYSGEHATVTYASSGQMIDVDLPVNLLKSDGSSVRLIIRTEDDINGVAPSESMEEISGRLIMWNYPYESIEDSPHIYVEVMVNDLTVETEDPENVEADNFDMLGNIENCSIEFIDSKGFEWKEGSDGGVTSVEAAAGFMAYCRYKYNLEIDTTKDIYYRAWGENENGKFYGNWVVLNPYTLTNIKAERRSELARVRLYGEIS